jgi:hypothetical protein
VRRQTVRSGTRSRRVERTRIRRKLASSWRAGQSGGQSSRPAATAAARHARRVSRPGDRFGTESVD